MTPRLVISHLLIICSFAMSDSEQDASVLGKRARDVNESSGKEDLVVPAVEHESDDDDVGPMPATNSAVKKKRKGM
jgi:hypothetical protein